MRVCRMIKQEVLAEAKTRDILSAEQAERLAALAAEIDRQAGEPIDRERLRLVTGFSDVFVTFGIVMFFSATYYFAARSLGPVVAFAALASLSWLLAEIFTRRFRQALPSIVLVTVFAMAAFSATRLALGQYSGESAPSTFWTVFYFFAPLSQLPMSRSELTSPLFVGAAVVAALAAALHYRRFATPIAIAIGATMLAAASIGLLGMAAPGFVESAFRLLLLAAGLALFALAMRFDLSDPARETRRADVAFWLHLSAAPLIVHPLVNPFMTGGVGPLFGNPSSVILFVALLVAVSLAIDRRALLVAGLAYVSFIMGSLTVAAGFFGAALPMTLLVLGTLVLLLSAGWTPMRNALLRALPKRWALRLPRPAV